MNARSTLRHHAPQATPKPLKARKYRSSCDACSASKVKCNQGKPHCARCMNLGLECNYSPSRRMGKPPASARKLINSSSTCQLAKPSSPRPELRFHSTKKRQSSPSTSFSEPWIHPLRSDQGHVPAEFSIINDPGLLGIDWQNAFYESPMPTFDNPSFALQNPLTSSNCADLSFDLGTSAEHPQLQHNSSYILSDNSSNTAMRDHLHRFPPCFTPCSPLQTQQELSPPSGICSPKPSSAPHLPIIAHPLHDRRDLFNPHFPTDNSTQTTNAHTLLSPLCPRTPHFALAIALTCVKLLQHSEAIIHATPPPQRRFFTPEEWTEGGRLAGEGGAEASHHLSRRLGIQGAADELCRVKSLVDRFTSKYCCGDADADVDVDERDEADADAGDRGMYAALEVFLRSKLAGTMCGLMRAGARY